MAEESKQPMDGATKREADPAMEDILSSIRRILSDENVPQPAPAASAPPQSAVLVLDQSMMVEGEKPVADKTTPAQTHASGLVAPEAAEAAAHSVESLVRTIGTGQTMLHRGGPSLEEIVREELRPMLKAWLDTSLPPIVERVVRQEIERVVGRAAP